MSDGDGTSHPLVLYPSASLWARSRRAEMDRYASRRATVSMRPCRRRTPPSCSQESASPAGDDDETSHFVLTIAQSKPLANAELFLLLTPFPATPARRQRARSLDEPGTGKRYNPERQSVLKPARTYSLLGYSTHRKLLAKEELSFPRNTSTPARRIHQATCRTS